MVVHLLQNQGEKKFFFQKGNICVFYEIYIICSKKHLHTKQKFYTEKKTYIKNREIDFSTENFCVTNKNINIF